MNEEFYSETLLDLSRKEHSDSIREALLFCCTSSGTEEQKVEEAIRALRNCARWFPTRGSEYAHNTPNRR